MKEVVTEASNEKALKILEQQYSSFINQQNNWNFFLGLAEYVKTAQELAQTRSIIEFLEVQRNTSRKLYEQMNVRALKELTTSAGEIGKIVQSVAQQCEPAIRALKEVEGYLKGTILSSNSLQGLNNSIFDMARSLRASGFAETIKRFEDEQRKVKNTYGNYTFSPTYEKISDEEAKLKRKEQVEPWGAWDKLPVVKELVFEPEKLTEEIEAEAQKDPQAKWTLFNFIGVIGELEKIRSGKASDSDVVFFKVKDFRSFAQRVHNYIATELLKTDDEEKPQRLDFDATKSVLYFADKAITISKRAENDAHELLRTIFKNRSKVWNSDEVLDAWQVAHNKSRIPKNKVYQAGRAVNRIVAQETTTKDFLDVSTKTVAINRKYLSG